MSHISVIFFHVLFRRKKKRKKKERTISCIMLNKNAQRLCIFKERSLNIPMRSWHGKVAKNVFLRVPAFLMTNKRVALTIHSSNTSCNCEITVVHRISMEFHPL